MKILEPGQPKMWTFKVVCTGVGNGSDGCGAKLLIDRNDLRYYVGTDHIIFREPAVVFRCAQCGVCTDLAHKHWPKHSESLPRFTSLWSETGVDNKNAEQWQQTD